MDLKENETLNSSTLKKVFYELLLNPNQTAKQVKTIKWNTLKSCFQFCKILTLKAKCLQLVACFAKNSFHLVTLSCSSI